MAEFVLSDEILDIDEENKAKNNSKYQKRRKTKEKTNSTNSCVVVKGKFFVVVSIHVKIKL